MSRKSLSSNKQRELQQLQKDVAEVLEQKPTTAITNEETAILEQIAAVTAARKEETIDCKDPELLTLIERRKHGQ